MSAVRVRSSGARLATSGPRMPLVPPFSQSAVVPARMAGWEARAAATTPRIAPGAAPHPRPAATATPDQESTGRLRVAFLAGDLEQGGAEKQLLYMVRALTQIGVAVRVYCL